MKKKNRKKTILTGFLLAFLILGLLVLMAGPAYARYRKHLNKETDFYVRKPGELEIYSEKGWVLHEDGSYKCTYLIKQVAVTEAESLYYSLQLVSTMGIGSPENITVTMTVDNANGAERLYTGSGRLYDEASVYYSESGPGYLYHFYDQSDTEILLEMDGTGEDQQEITIHVQGANDAALLELILTEIP